MQELTLHGHDPLETSGPDTDTEALDATKLQVQNILKCYTHFFDIFGETLQNALDAVEARKRKGGNDDYMPRICIRIDIPGRMVRVVDNGIGMTEKQFKYCFRPNVSFKKSGEYRGQKGVGATFLAYGFSHVRLQSKQNGQHLAAAIIGGRQWANDSTNRVPRPVFQQISWDVPDLAYETCGTSIEITIGREPGERPSDLSWMQATTAAQWLEILRIKTPLGQIYLTGRNFAPEVTLEVVDPSGQLSRISNCKTEYFYPHEIPGIKEADLADLTVALSKTDGDPKTRMLRLPEQFKRLNCLWRIWTTDEITSENSPFKSEQLTEDELTLCTLHSVVVYGSFVNSLDVWDKFSDDILNLRKKQRVLRGGLQMATDNMVQGDLIPIPLLKAVGYQHQSHVIVHLTHGSPDLGRKTFQPEYQQLAEKLAKAALQIFIRYRDHLRPDTGTAQMLPDRQLQDWMRDAENWRKLEPLKAHGTIPGISMASKPREEQDVVSLAHELVGAGILRGYEFLAATSNDRYDALFELNYPDDSYCYDSVSNPLGVSHELPIPFQSATEVLEYKFDLDGLARDFDKQIKFANHVNLAICWSITGENLSRLEFRSLLVERAGEIRTHYGATHAAYVIGSDQPAFEVIALQDLIEFLADPETEKARQKTRYGHL